MNNLKFPIINLVNCGRKPFMNMFGLLFDRLSPRQANQSNSTEGTPRQIIGSTSSKILSKAASQININSQNSSSTSKNAQPLSNHQQSFNATSALIKEINIRTNNSSYSRTKRNANDEITNFNRNYFARNILMTFIQKQRRRILAISLTPKVSNPWILQRKTPTRWLNRSSKVPFLLRIFQFQCDWMLLNCLLLRWTKVASWIKASVF